MTDLPTAAPTNEPTTPACRLTADVQPLQGIGGRRLADVVRLPPRFAVRALTLFFDETRWPVEVVEGPARLGRDKGAPTITAEQWAVRSRSDLSCNPMFPRDIKPLPQSAWFVFPKHTVILERHMVEDLLRALEAVKPIEVDTEGRPLPWVVPRRRPVGETPSREEDVSVVPVGQVLPGLEAASEAARGLSEALIRQQFSELVALSGLNPDIELELIRGDTDRRGFVTGRVWFEQGGRVRRVRLVTCPNADLAEVIATVVHELAHPLAHGADGSRAHDRSMKEAMVALAARRFGPEWFGQAREALGGTIREADAWVTTGIRAALRGGEVPQTKTADDGQVARILGKIKKLRELAADQCGLPEGIAATGAANDLMTLYGLVGRDAQLDDIDPASMIDRWFACPKGVLWKRQLATAIAHYFGVFGLNVPSTGCLHLFGAYADLVATEYLIEVSMARIERECERHIAAWKARLGGRTTGGMTRSEKSSFCTSAAVAFGRKLMRIKEEEGAGRDLSRDRAEDFAAEEYARRGRGWGRAGRRTYRANAAGQAVGESMEVLHGVDGAPAARLGHKG